MADRYLFSSESVAAGHPDKVADQISDGVLDAILRDDPEGRVACETLVTTGMALVAGEITTACYVDIPEIVRGAIREIGYTSGEMGISWDNCAVLTSIDKQSGDIAMGVNGEEIGAGDQGFMFGFACDETPEYMPAALMIAHDMMRRLAGARKSGALPYLRPDGKCQVTIEYEGFKPLRVTTVVLGAQHSEDVSTPDLRADIAEKIIAPAIPDELKTGGIEHHINATGRFVTGGPQGDCGMTGRKIIADTYGGYARHGGGAFSGKDPTKVDRSGAYAARWAAKNVVAAGLADRCEIQLAYCIGVARPVSISVSTFGTGKIADAEICRIVDDGVDFSPGGIIERLGLRRPIFKKTAAFGHFGREDDDFTWEKLDLADDFRKKV